MPDLAQDKQNEIAFFDDHAAIDAYDVFTGLNHNDWVNVA